MSNLQIGDKIGLNHIGIQECLKIWPDWDLSAWRGQIFDREMADGTDLWWALIKPELGSNRGQQLVSPQWLKKISNLPCQCGAFGLGHPGHSHWCPAV